MIPIKKINYLLAGLVFVALGVLMYSNTWHFPFVFDDVALIVNSPYLRMEHLSLESIGNVFKDVMAFRPLTTFSFALNHLWGEYDVAGYRAVNVAIHIFTGIVLFFFFNLTLALCPEKSDHSRCQRRAAPAFVAFFAALLWFSSPLGTQAVTYVFQRGHSMASMFYVASMLFYAKGREAQCRAGRQDAPTSYAWFGACAGAGLLAMLSKAIAATLPLYIFLYEWYFFRRLDKGWLRRHAHWILYGLVPALLYGVAHFFMGTPEEQTRLYSHATYTLWEHLLTEGRVAFYYLSLIAYPHPSRMIFDHGFGVSRSLFDPATTLLSFLAVAGLIGVAVVMAKKRPLVSFAILWYFGQLVLEAVVPFELLWDYRTYLPSMFVHLLAVVLIFRVARNTQAATVGLCVMVAVFSLWTYERNKVYRDPVSLWTDTVQKAPKNARARNNLAEKILRDGRIDEAIAHLEEALRVNPQYASAHNNLANALRAKGRIDEAARHYQKALELNPDHPYARQNLENMVARARFEAMFREALRVNPQDAGAHYALGNMMAQRKMFDEAMRHYQEVLKIEPEAVDARNNLAVVYMELGRFDKAAEEFEKVLSIDPDYEKAQIGLNMVLERMGQ